MPAEARRTLLSVGTVGFVIVWTIVATVVALRESVVDVTSYSHTMGGLSCCLWSGLPLLLLRNVRDVFRALRRIRSAVLVSRLLTPLTLNRDRGRRPRRGAVAVRHPDRCRRRGHRLDGVRGVPAALLRGGGRRAGPVLRVGRDFQQNRTFSSVPGRHPRIASPVRASVGAARYSAMAEGSLQPSPAMTVRTSP